MIMVQQLSYGRPASEETTWSDTGMNPATRDGMP